MRRVVTGSVAAISTIGSVVALVYGLLGYGPGPRWLWLLIAYAEVRAVCFRVQSQRESTMRPHHARLAQARH